MLIDNWLQEILQEGDFPLFFDGSKGVFKGNTKYLTAHPKPGIMRR
jgi:hypothetical protein